MEEAQLVLIRGIPGSGKSTMAKTEYADHVHYEADQYFIRDGVYRFNPKKLKEAHERCRELTLKSLQNGDKVVVSNTFTRVWEMQPYLDMGFPVKVVTATGNYENVHNVPKEAVERMKLRFEKYP